MPDAPPPWLVLIPGGGGARLAIHDRRLARLLVYLATKGRRWRLEDEGRGTVTLRYDGDAVEAMLVAAPGAGVDG